MNIQSPVIIGLDVGGSHVCGAVVKTNAILAVQQKIVHKMLDTAANAFFIIDIISKVINENIGEVNSPVAVGIAMPGPFNYAKGISEIYGVGGKFGSTFGLHMEEALKTFAHLPKGTEIYFANDAHCFAIGADHLLKLKSKRTICITLGTGFGSAFLKNKKLVPNHRDIPLSGAFYCEPFRHSIADDHFSTRWFLNEYKKVTGKNIYSVEELAKLADREDHAKNIFETFGKNMACFLTPWLKKFECDTLVIGGNILKAWNLFGEVFCRNIAANHCNGQVLICHDTEQCIITGAALQAEEKNNFFRRKGFCG